MKTKKRMLQLCSLGIAVYRGGGVNGNGGAGDHKSAQHNQQSASGRAEHRAGLGDQPGQYATLSKQCKTLESSDFYWGHAPSGPGRLKKIYKNYTFDTIYSVTRKKKNLFKQSVHGLATIQVGNRRGHRASPRSPGPCLTTRTDPRISRLFKTHVRRRHSIRRIWRAWSAARRQPGIRIGRYRRIRRANRRGSSSLARRRTWISFVRWWETRRRT